MKAISLWQPWASAIAAGVKTVETRSWPTSYRGPLAIHAAKRWTAQEEAFWVEYVFDDPRSPNSEAFSKLGIHSCLHLPKGCIVATCELYDCLSTSSEADAEKMGRHPQADDESNWGDYSGVNRFHVSMLRNVKAYFITPGPVQDANVSFEWAFPSPGPDAGK